MSYALAATNWSARTYAAAQREQARLASGRLQQSLRAGPTAAQIEQLQADHASHLGALLRARVSRGSSSRATVLIDIDELRVAAGQRIRQVVRYRVILQRVSGRWSVSAFGAVSSETQP